MSLNAPNESQQLQADLVRLIQNWAEQWPGTDVGVRERGLDGTLRFEVQSTNGGTVGVRLVPLPVFQRHQGYGHPGPPAPLSCEGCRDRTEWTRTAWTRSAGPARTLRQSRDLRRLYGVEG